MAQLSYNINRRRMRVSTQVRELVGSVSLSYKEFIQPLFVEEGIREAKKLENMQGVFSDSKESLLKQIEDDLAAGVSKFLLFPVPAKKQSDLNDFSFATSILEQIKANFGNDVWVAADCCLCSYTTHGHCGVLDQKGSKIDNQASVDILSRYALQLGQAGASCIAPSDMMDGRIASIRSSLDVHGLDEVGIMSYSAKFSSQLYGPFRDACHSSPADGKIKDRKSYQLSPANPEDAILSSIRDAEEGADILMVKPAGWYTDIILRIKEQVSRPLAAYHVSGEYAAIECLAEKGIVDREAAHLELWTALKRAGADIIISYASREAREWIKQVRV
jgi:porphobilinogen synthase